MSDSWNPTALADDAIPFLDANGVPARPKLVLRDDDRGAYLYHGDCRALMDAIIEKHPDGCFDMIFADPPYRLSNGGMTCYAGKAVKVDKGNWDQSEGPELDFEFTIAWLEQCQKLLKKDGTIWVSGTHHIIHIVGYAMQRLGYKILNEIAWEKPNPPPNLSCRFFTHSTETILWAAKTSKSKHRFNYNDMRMEAGGKQMKTVWRILPPTSKEKIFGKHPTQKPVSLLNRIVLASTLPSDFIFDPFCGSSTTGVSALTQNRKYCGIDSGQQYVDISVNRLLNI
jgi:site-specific DNA-methyltransferase (adenine-specific)